MMQPFLEVLGLPLLACVALTSILGYLGLHVLEREIVFIDIALAQVVAVGAIVAHVAFGAHGDSPLSYACAFGAALAVAAFYAFARQRVVQISLEAVIGVSYAIAAAGALFLVGIAPGGHVHVQHMLAGSILWTTWKDILVCAPVFALVGLCFYLLRKPLARVSRDYANARQEGMRVAWWDFLFYGLISVVITLAVKIAGVVLVFAFLIIPATVSALFASRWTTRMLVAWAVGVPGSVLGLLLADRLDLPVGPAVTLLLGLLLVLAAVWRVCRPVVSTSVCFLAVCGYAAVLSGPEPADGPPLQQEVHNAVPMPSRAPAHPGLVDHSETEGPPTEDVEAIHDIETLQRLSQSNPDPARGSAIVCRALRVVPRQGASLALRFLQDDPPPFFAQRVVERLDTTAGVTFHFDVALSFEAPTNATAAAAVRRTYGLPDD